MQGAGDRRGALPDAAVLLRHACMHTFLSKSHLRRCMAWSDTLHVHVQQMLSAILVSYLEKFDEQTLLLVQGHRPSAAAISCSHVFPAEVRGSVSQITDVGYDCVLRGLPPSHFYLADGHILRPQRRAGAVLTLHGVPACTTAAQGTQPGAALVAPKVIAALPVHLMPRWSCLHHKCLDSLSGTVFDCHASSFVVHL